SFGIGGTNVHVVIEEAPAVEAAPSARPAQLLVLSAKSADALEAATARLSAHLAKSPDACLADVAYTLQVGRKTLPHRRALVARDARDAAKALGARDPSRLLAQTAETARDVAFLFSGQGSQHPGMGRGLYEHEPTFRAWVDRGAKGLPFDLLGALYGEGDPAERASRLRRTALAQPALFVVEYALAQLWLERGLRPAAMLGHSVGEYVAATLAGVMTYDEALALVAARGRIVDALPPGSMLSVSMPEDELVPLLGPSLSIAAVNGPGMCVVSGPSVAIDTFTVALAARGVASRRLQTSHAFHSAMMEGGLDAFRVELKKVRLSPPETPFVSNVTGAWVNPEEATDPEYWVRHLRGTVRFGKGLETLRASGDPILIEVGPGTALTTLARAGAPKGSAPSIASMRHPDQDAGDVETFLGAVGRAWLAGASPSWAGLHGGEKRRRVPLPTYPFQRKAVWPKLRGGTARGAERPAASAGQRVDDVGAWFYSPAWRHAPDPPPIDREKAPKRWLVLADRSGLGGRVAARLRELEGAEVQVIEAGEGPTTRAGHESLVASAAPEHVVDLRGVDPSRDDTSAFYDLLFLGQALASLESPARLTVVATGSQRLSDEALDPGKAAAMAAATVLGQEVPQLTCRHVDVPAKLRSIDLLVAELFAADATTRVALRGKRWVESLEPRPIAAAAKTATRLRRGGVYLVTGGLGRVGMTLCEALARGYGARLVLMGRSPLVESDERVARLEALGAEVAYVAGDVADPAAARAAVRAAVERFGALHGVIHAAGVPSTDLTLSTLAELTEGACEEQFRAKARGARALAAALEGHSPDFVVAMSSLATVLGGLGFAAYAAANAYLDAFARSEGGPWLSIGWDAWRDEQAGADAASFGAELARLAIAPAEGVEAFERLLGAPPADAVLISTADLGARVAKWVHRVGAEAPRAAATGATASRPELTTPYVAPSGEVEEAIAQIWRELLGFEQVGVHDDFMELGGHSLIATQVVSRVRKTFQIDVPMRAFLEAPTVAKFTDVVTRARAAEAAPDQLDDLLARLEGLSEAEAAELLSA
ncbi:MAG TPA: SDR family NAD(P)-dependent oxidoreductase, partial [Polyangiaceae bacterium]|nr:SDR family NAD(P)-dependent oxidoreductase [Polyangiaceae bacterium]